MFFAILLLLSALPLWRALDMLVWFNLNRYLVVSLFFCWSTLCIITPLSLIYRRLFVPGLTLNICFACLVYFFSNPFSTISIDNPEDRHCSLLNFSGLFYNLKDFMPSAHEDDLLIRNQICWAKKLSLSIPDNIGKHESDVYLKLVEDKLILPEIKWKSTLPFLVPIYIKVSKADPVIDVIEAQKFWNNHYTAEIADREYNFLSYPHSDYIKWEYGLFEKYWPNFVTSIEIEKP